MGQKVEVFGSWFSPFSRRVELALKLKGIDYDYIEEEIYKKKSDLILEYNPVYKKLLVLGPIMEARRRQGKVREEAIAETREAFRALEEELTGKRFFGGETLGFVDIVANVVAYWIPPIEQAFGLDDVFSGEMQKLPNLRRWSREFVEHSIVKETLPPEHDIVSFVTSQFASK